jgi:hypothetical protein
MTVFVKELFSKKNIHAHVTLVKIKGSLRRLRFWLILKVLPALSLVICMKKIKFGRYYRKKDVLFSGTTT